MSTTPGTAAAAVENRYSRQIYAIGAAAVRRLIHSNVVIVGLTATGAEIAKNVLLSGCPDVKLYDATPVSAADFESNYFVGPDQIGLPRGQAAVSALAPLNPTATLTVLSSLEELDTVRASAVVIVDPLRCGITASQLEAIMDRLHERNIPVTLVEVWGLCARVFNDFGANHVVEDPLGEDPPTLTVVRSETLDGGRLLLLELDVADHLLALGENDFAVASDNTGVRRLIRVAQRRGSNTIVVEVSPADAAALGSEYPPADEAYWNLVQENNLRVSVTELIRPRSIEFQRFSVARREPSILLSFVRDQTQFHALFEALHRSAAPLPKLRDTDDAAHFWSTLAGAGTNSVVPPESLAKVFAETAAAELIGVAAFIGGIASQEVLKAVTGRFTPVQQFWYADQLSCIAPSDLAERPPDEPRPFALPPLPPGGLASQTMPSHRAIFANWDNFKNANLFVIGAGAIGCEYLKNLALLGVGTGPKGRITVTDNDSIEVSNLSRQFLFREQHVGHNKATTAAAAINAKFPKVKIRALKEKVCRDTSDPVEGVFNTRFWAQTTVICNAVDNMAAREFLDDRAVEHRRPMIDSGTQGARGHVEVFAPFATKRFRDDSGPADQGKKIPFCTLHYFPTLIEHCIQYASDFFNQTFSATPTDVTRCLQAATPDAYAGALEASARPAVIGAIHATVCRHFPRSIADAFSWARGLFEITFVHGVRRILENYPKDKLDEDGKPYWSGSRRAPTLPEFSVDDPDALTFVATAALLWLRVHYGTERLAAHIPSAPATFEEAEEQARQFFTSGFFVPLPTFVPSKVVIDEKKDGAAAAQPTTAAVAEEAPVQQWLSDIAAHKAARLQALRSSGDDAEAVGMHPEVFEKDDDSNGHIALITAIANLRARCYSIAPETRLKVKRIAGRIIPAMITTTAAVTGLATMALCRMLSVGVNGTLTPLRWRQVVDGTDSSVVWLSSTDQLYQAFIPGDPRALSVFEHRASAGSDRYVGVPNSPTFTCWDRIEVRGTVSTTIADVVAAVKERFHGVTVLQLVEASSDQWVYDGAKDETSLGAFSLALWTQRFLKITDDQLDARGQLQFIVKCGPPAEMSALHPSARVNPMLPPLLFTFK